jgi:flagellar motor component MotA
MNDHIIWIIAVLGLVTLGGVFYRMQGGGPFNLRAVGIVMVATFAALLALKDSSSLTAAMGILGAIAGYLFGIRDSKTE